MSDVNWSSVWTFLGVIMFSVSLASLIVWSQPERDSLKQVPCYDEYNNKINELTCEEKIIGISRSEKIQMIIIFYLSFIIGWLFLVLSLVISERRQTGGRRNG